MATKEEIRGLINSDPEVKALLPNTGAIAQRLSQGRVKYVHTEIGTGTIIEALGLAPGNQVLDVIYNQQDFRHVKPLLDQGRLRLDSAFVRAALQSMVPALITQQQCDTLIGRTEQPDPISEFEVRCAVFNDDGSLKV